MMDLRCDKCGGIEYSSEAQDMSSVYDGWTDLKLSVINGRYQSRQQGYLKDKKHYLVINPF